MTSATPVLQTCPTTAESVPFEVAGSCGPVGLITVSTMPGLCEIEVYNGPTVGLPEHGNFSGAASETHYEITGGNWSLFGQSSDPAADPSTVQCTVTPAAVAGALTVTCDINTCIPSGDDNGFQCTPGTCVMHLTAPTPDAGAETRALEAGTDAPPESGTEAGNLEAGE